jgi:hypothetical protein
MIEAFREYLMGGFRGSMGFNPLTAAEYLDTTFKGGPASAPTSGSLLQLGPKVFHFNANDPFKMPEIVGSCLQLGPLLVLAQQLIWLIPDIKRMVYQA